MRVNIAGPYIPDHKTKLLEDVKKNTEKIHKDLETEQRDRIKGDKRNFWLSIVSGSVSGLMVSGIVLLLQYLLK
ncbi:MAG: hypothetical protein RSF13_03135 [Clostridiales bacterium]